MTHTHTHMNTRTRLQVARKRAEEAGRLDNKGFLFEALALLELQATEFFPNEAATVTGDLNTPGYGMVQVKAHDGRFPVIQSSTEDIEQLFEIAMDEDVADYWMVWMDESRYMIFSKDNFRTLIRRHLGTHNNPLRLTSDRGKAKTLRLNFGKASKGFFQKAYTVHTSTQYEQVRATYEKAVKARKAREAKEKEK